MLEELEVVLEITGGHQPHIVEVGGKDVGVFVDGAVLYNRSVSVQDLEDLLVAAVEEEDLQVEGPALHIVVEVAQVGVIIRRFIMDIPTEMPAELFSEGGLAGADVAGDSDMFYHWWRILLRLAHSIVSLSATKIDCLGENFKLFI